MHARIKCFIRRHRAAATIVVGVAVVCVVVALMNATYNHPVPVPDSAPVAFGLTDADVIVELDSTNDGVITDSESGCAMNLTYRGDLATATVTDQSARDGCTVELSVGLGTGVFTEYNTPDQSTSIARGSGWSTDGFAIRLCDQLGQCLVVLRFLPPSATIQDGPPANQTIQSPDVAPG